MRLINFSKNCVVSNVGLVYPTGAYSKSNEFYEKRLVIPFVGFSKNRDFSTDHSGRLLLDADFDLQLEGTNLFLVKSGSQFTKHKIKRNPEKHSFLLLYSVPYDPEGRFYSFKGDRAPEEVYSFTAGAECVNGLSYEMLMVLNFGVSYRFFYSSDIYNSYFCSLKINSLLELELRWEKQDNF